MPRQSSFYISSPVVLGFEHMRVKDLLLEGQNRWNEYLLYGLFLPEKVNEIRSIVLSSRRTEDSLVWHGIKDVVYSIKSGYNFIVTILLPLEPCYYSGFWKQLWQLKIPSKVRHFVWRCCRDILPSKDALRNRGVQIGSNCLFCGRNETTVHALVACSHPQDVLNFHWFHVSSDGYLNMVELISNYSNL